MQAGIALAPEDRKSTGLVLGASVGTNVSMAVLPRLARAQFIDQKAERNLIHRFVKRLNIRTPSQEQKVRTFERRQPAKGYDCQMAGGATEMSHCR